MPRISPAPPHSSRPAPPQVSISAGRSLYRIGIFIHFQNKRPQVEASDSVRVVGGQTVTLLPPPIRMDRHALVERWVKYYSHTSPARRGGLRDLCKAPCSRWKPTRLSPPPYKSACASASFRLSDKLQSSYSSNICGRLPPLTESSRPGRVRRSSRTCADNADVLPIHLPCSFVESLSYISNTFGTLPPPDRCSMQERDHRRSRIGWDSSESSPIPAPYSSALSLSYTSIM